MTKISLNLSKGKLLRSVYLEKEEEAKITSLGSQKCINRVFDLMGVEYDDRPILAEEKDEAAERAKGWRRTRKLLRRKGPDLLPGSARLPSLVMCG